MARDVAPILQLVAFCAVIPSAGVVMILFPDTFLLPRRDGSLGGTNLREIKTDFFTERLSLMERIILGIWHGYL